MLVLVVLIGSEDCRQRSVMNIQGSDKESVVVLK